MRPFHCERRICIDCCAEYPDHRHQKQQGDRQEHHVLDHPAGGDLAPLPCNRGDTTRQHGHTSIRSRTTYSNDTRAATATSTTAAAVPYPSTMSLIAVWNTYTGRVEVAVPGPPPVRV